MFIVFDLDDTLIETTKCLTPTCLRDAFEALKLDPHYLARLMLLNDQAYTSRQALDQFCEEMGCDAEQTAAAHEALTPKLPLKEKIEQVPGALEVLKNFSATHILALVTRGTPELQLAKMENAGIQQEFFSKLIVSQGASKKKDYQLIIDELHLRPEEGIVVGDRIDFDLTPAKELGLFTVHFRNGRGKNHTEPQENIDRTIETLKQLEEVFDYHES